MLTLLRSPLLALRTRVAAVDPLAGPFGPARLASSVPTASTAAGLCARPAASAVGAAVARPTPGAFRWLSDAAAAVEERYAKPLAALHWVYAAGMLTVLGTVKGAQWTTGETALGSKAQTKGKLMTIHKSTAVILAALVVPRVLLKAATRAPAHLAGHYLEHLAANLSHTAMYGFMLVMPATGLAMGYYGGKGVPFFGLFTIPGKADKTKEDGKFAGQMFSWHKWTGQFMYYFVGLHVSAAFFHAARGQAIFARMSPFGAAPPP